MKKILNNVKVLYAVFFVAVLNISYFVFNKDSQSIFLFAIISLIIYLFNENMIIVLGFTMICVNGLILMNQFEGMEDKPGPNIEPKNFDYSDEKKEMLKELLPLTQAMEGLDIEKVNQMIGNLNKIIERF
jgi:hypothetical protein